MEIVCDTNIWYELGQTPPMKDFLKEHQLIGTFHAIDELSRTSNLIGHYDYTRSAIQALMTFSKPIFYEPPLIYLKRLNKPNFSFNPAKELKSILNFTMLIANGIDIVKDKQQDFKTYCENRRNELQKAADFFNEKAAKIKPKITHKEKHRKEDSIPVNRKLISFFVASSCKDTGLDETFDWSNVELFESVLKVVFNDMEIGAMTLTMNDWYDLFNLIYVTPGRLYWTREKKWINLIKKAGMEKYLFVQEQNNKTVEIKKM
jgi:hypothetical protein